MQMFRGLATSFVSLPWVWVSLAGLLSSGCAVTPSRSVLPQPAQYRGTSQHEFMLRNYNHDTYRDDWIWVGKCDDFLKLTANFFSGEPSHLKVDPVLREWIPRIAPDPDWKPLEKPYARHWEILRDIRPVLDWMAIRVNRKTGEVTFHMHSKAHWITVPDLLDSPEAIVEKYGTPDKDYKVVVQPETLYGELKSELPLADENKTTAHRLEYGPLVLSAYKVRVWLIVIPLGHQEHVLHLKLHAANEEEAKRLVWDLLHVYDIDPSMNLRRL